ncbi:MAG: cytochrome c oxidase subunit 2 [Saprospiraceae bacterium]|jgi:cytochrome c oxidase subunit 2
MIPFIIACLILIAIIVVQIGRVSELSAKIRGEKEAEQKANEGTAGLMMPFLIVFLVLCIYTAYYYKNWMLGFGPLTSASEHGFSIDSLFNVTTVITGIVFLATHILLFYFAYKYQQKPDRVGEFISHDNKLEVIWTAIPAVVMTFLVVGGLDAWNEITADVPLEAKSTLRATGENEFIEIEGTGYQFAWHLRYPGEDGKLGARNYKKINGVNPLGQVWTDEKNLDDFHPAEIYLPVGKQVRVRITARDVLHNFYLPHFRVKMDAVPGLPTYFVFTPTSTTEDFRLGLKEYPEYNVPDPEEPEKMLWETFDFELACAELCGSGHYSMRRLVKIVSEREYDEWLSNQSSYYFSSIRDTDEDPFKGTVLDFEKKERGVAFNDKLSTILAQPDSLERIIRFDYVTFATGKANLTQETTYELDFLVDALKKSPSMTIEVAGHTDNTGAADTNMALSDARAKAVFGYLVSNGVSENRLQAAGYGQTKPVVDNDTTEGRQENRRTEFKILTK